jgi:hypothetical protein
MKSFVNRSIAVFAVAAALGISIPSVAFADSSTTTLSTNTTAAVATPWTTWRATWVTYVQGLKSINSTYHSAMSSARQTLHAALSASTNKTERQAAFAASEVSADAALNARVAAITAAGDPPSPPAGYNGTAWVTSFQSDNVAFRASIVAAQTALSLALTGATPQEARTARLTYRQSVGAAISAHSTALLALGNPPAHGGQPLS